MKKYVSVLMLLLAAFMFFNCESDSGSDSKGEEATKITLDKKAVSVDADGGTAVIKATITPAGKTTIKSWTSNRTGIATVSNGTITGVSPGTATITVTTEDGKTDTCAVTVNVPSFKLVLDPATWGALPDGTTHNQSNGTDWPADFAAHSYANGELTLTFDGRNRQRGVIPLTTEQTERLLTEYARNESGVTFRIDGTVKNEDGTDSRAEFRLHLANPSITTQDNHDDTSVFWNATQTGLQTALIEHMVEFRGWDHAFDQETPDQNLKYFMIQAMFKYDKPADNDMTTIFPKVIITIRSLTIDIGNTIPEEPEE